MRYGFRFAENIRIKLPWTPFMPELVRIRFTRIPPARDLEYFAMRYIRLNGVYEVPLEMAAELVEFGFASLARASGRVDEFGTPGPLPDDDISE